MVKISVLVGIVAVAAFYCNVGTVRNYSSNLAALQDLSRSSRVLREWETSFFKALNERTKRINLPSLRTTPLGENDIEVRFWYDARPDIINGFVLRRLGNRWSAVGVRQVRDRWPSAVIQEKLPRPKSGWDGLWKQLVDFGVLSLPDGYEKPECHTQVLDGMAFVIETNANGKYRTYRYDNPQFADCDEAKRMNSIESLIGSEFRIQKK